jgi:hypothetical protein
VIRDKLDPGILGHTLCPRLDADMEPSPYNDDSLIYIETPDYLILGFFLRNLFRSCKLMIMWLSRLTLSSKYERILEQTIQDNSGHESKPEVQDTLSRKFTSYIVTCSALFILGTISGVCLSQYSLQHRHGSYEHGFATEISTAPAI